MFIVCDWRIMVCYYAYLSPNACGSPWKKFITKVWTDSCQTRRVHATHSGESYSIYHFAHEAAHGNCTWDIEVGDPEAESPKATHPQHVHVEQHDDASTQTLKLKSSNSASNSASHQTSPKPNMQHSRIIQRCEQLSEPSDSSKSKHGTCTQ